MLVVGGMNANDAPLNTCEIYDPTTGTWSYTGSMTYARKYHTTSRIADGRIIVIGGQDANNNPMNTAEEYNPSTGTWSLIGSLTEGRYDHGAAVLFTGQIVITGCYGVNGYMNSIKIYNPFTVRES